jgi:hypothetical protein
VGWGGGGLRGGLDNSLPPALVLSTVGVVVHAIVQRAALLLFKGGE